MSLILQISDPHFGTEQPEVADALVALVRREAPRLLVLSGDITQRATAAQFAAASRFCARLELPQQLVIPGNHDIPLMNPLARLFAPYARYQRAFGAALEPQFADAHWLVLGVNTTRPWRHAAGVVGKAQIARVAERLRQAAPQQTRVVVVHQPLLVREGLDVGDRLRHWEEAARSWAEAGADIVMGGHLHLPYVLPMQASLAGLARPLWCVQAGTALSHRVRGRVPNSVNLLRRHQDAASGRVDCDVERYDYAAAERSFVLVASTRLKLAQV